MFGKKPKKRDSFDLDELKELVPQTSAKNWVNSLLMHMYQDSIKDFILQQCDGIPSIRMSDIDLSEDELDFDKIINRLKIMSGLDPILFSETKRGKIDLVLGGVPYILQTQFIDSASNSICQIRMSKKNEKENSGK
jgi:hypothetical protein